MTDQTPEVPVDHIDVPAEVEAPSRFKTFRINHPRIITAVGTLASVGIVSAVVAAVKSSKDDGALALGTDAEELYRVDPESVTTDAPTATEA